MGITWRGVTPEQRVALSRSSRKPRGRKRIRRNHNVRGALSFSQAENGERKEISPTCVKISFPVYVSFFLLCPLFIVPGVKTIRRATPARTIASAINSSMIQDRFPIIQNRLVGANPTPPNVDCYPVQRNAKTTDYGLPNLRRS